MHRDGRAGCSAPKTCAPGACRRTGTSVGCARAGQDLEVVWQAPDGPRHLYLDTQYNDAFGLLHENSDLDAVEAPELLAKPDTALRVFFLSPLDLAVSKLGRFDQRDQSDIVTLARAGLIDVRRFRTHALEALDDYVGSTERVRTSIDIASGAIEAAG